MTFAVFPNKKQRGQSPSGLASSIHRARDKLSSLIPSWFLCHTAPVSIQTRRLGFFCFLYRVFERHNQWAQTTSLHCHPDYCSCGIWLISIPWPAWKLGCEARLALDFPLLACGICTPASQRKNETQTPQTDMKTLFTHIYTQRQD